MIDFKKLPLILSVFLLFFSCNGQTENDKKVNTMTDSTNTDSLNTNLSTATFGAGCFWCVEAIFDELKGVSSVTSGYMGGQTDNPTYKEVCGGRTGHAEVAQIKYDSTVISFDELLEVFFKVHDPTTLNRQGADVGTQYRSAIFYHNENQKKEAEEIISQLNQSGAWENPIVTEVSEASKYYIAENYHQNYLENNPDNGYCRAVVRPKLDKFRKVFKDKLK